MPARQSSDPLQTYRQKRRFTETPEPEGGAPSKGRLLYAIQKHDARRLHYDLRLELDGVLKSWAITRGPSLDPSQRRLAVRTEDHPMDYISFEGNIPRGNYGAGTVMLWDEGTWEPVGSARQGLAKGKLVFNIHGRRLKGQWALVRFRGKDAEKHDNWLLIKHDDEAADPDFDVTAEETTSVATGRDLAKISTAKEVWHSNRDNGKSTARKSKAGKRKNRTLPAFLNPALATLVDEVPEGKDWLFEVKLDGYRAITAASGDDVRIYTRNGHDWTDRFSSVARAVAELNLDAVLLDGEVVAIDSEGRASFGDLQASLKSGGRNLSYFVFDLLIDGGKDLRKRPLTERKRRLQALLGDAGRQGPVFYTDHVEEAGREVLDQLCSSGFEGIIAKRATASYPVGRGRSWLKIKCDREQEFVVIGWAPSTTSRPFSSILLGVHEDGKLRYAGKAGSGFSDEVLASLAKRLKSLARDKPAVTGIPRAITRNAHWVKPELVAQIEFAEFTRDGLIRQGRFVGLREDKPAATVIREVPKDLEEVTAVADDLDMVKLAGIRLSHPDKVLYHEQGITKQDLASYLEMVAPRLLPHAANRLISLVRCPDGHRKQCFFQRHGGVGFPEELKRLRIRERKGGTKEYLYLSDLRGLIAAAQIGVLEFHIWGSHIDDIEKPDRIVFDLDPDPSVDFESVKVGALLVRDVLDALGLVSFPLLTGGKGVHIVAPIRRQYEWPVVKAFCGALAERIAEEDPDRYVATMSKSRRTGRIFVDHFRNERGSTAIAPYSPRAREDAPVAWPVTWKSLRRFKAANEITVANARKQIGKADPWEGYAETRQRLKVSALRALGIEP